MTRGPDLNIKLSTLFVSTFRGADSERMIVKALINYQL